MNILDLSPASSSIWDAYVASHPEATVFHLAGWGRVIEGATGHRAHYLMAMEGDRVAGIYPLVMLSSRLFGTMGVSLPFVGYGGMVSDSPEAEQALADEAARRAAAAGCRTIELRQRRPLKLDWPTTDRKVATALSTEGGSEQVMARLHQNVRNKIRKAEKSGVVVQEGPEHLPEFYDIYSRNLRDLGTPVMSRRFFEAALEAFPRHLKVYRAVRQGRTLAAKVVAMDARTCCFTWSASLRKELAHAPVHAMNWRAIEDACQAGCTHVDLGRSTAGTSHQDFKKYWGGESWTLPWAYQLLDGAEIPGLHKEDKRFSLAITLWKHLPLRVSRWLGPPIARCLP